MAEEKFINPRESVLVLLPSKGRPPRAFLDGIIRTLDTAEPGAATVVLLAPEEEDQSDPDVEPLVFGAIGKEVAKVVVKEVAKEAVQGIATVIRDSYRNEREARDYIARKYGWG